MCAVQTLIYTISYFICFESFNTQGIYNVSQAFYIPLTSLLKV